jgi:hypothetical protein
MGAKNTPYTLDQLADAGVKRVSTGSSFARAALTGLRDAALELLGPGTATYLDKAISSAEVAAVMAARVPGDEVKPVASPATFAEDASGYGFRWPVRLGLRSW